MAPYNRTTPDETAQEEEGCVIYSDIRGSKAGTGPEKRSKPHQKKFRLLHFLFWMYAPSPLKG
jgi:hypothetical protein